MPLISYIPPPTEAQVKSLEAALLQQFLLLVQGSVFRLNLARKYGLKNKQFLEYSATLDKLVKKWILKEVPYEKVLLQGGVKGLIASGNVKFEDFFESAKLPKLLAIAKKIDQEGKGIGFIPLLIWGVIAIISAFSAVKITDDLTTTSQEKAELMLKTKNVCQELNLTPEQCNAMISQTQSEASSGSDLGGIIKWVLIGFGLLFGINFISKQN